MMPSVNVTRPGMPSGKKNACTLRPMPGFEERRVSGMPQVLSAAGFDGPLSVLPQQPKVVWSNEFLSSQLENQKTSAQTEFPRASSAMSDYAAANPRQSTALNNTHQFLGAMGDLAGLEVDFSLSPIQNANSEPNRVETTEPPPPYPMNGNPRVTNTVQFANASEKCAPNFSPPPAAPQGQSAATFADTTGEGYVLTVINNLLEVVKNAGSRSDESRVKIALNDIPLFDGSCRYAA
ncbi:MAG: hypothetical protein GY696_03045 [Gammaproteobacteria bacterium]|nr:hypothetical protein [Gammaproteobacteria bacterium]